METVNIREVLDIFATIDVIIKISTTPVRCEVYLGGYQPTPIRCALDVHTGQHAGIGDNGATVIWPDTGELKEIERLKKKVAHLNKLFDLWAISLGICSESRDQLKHENRSISKQFAASESAREQQGREIAGLRESLLKIVDGSGRRFSQDPPPEEFQSLCDHDSGARLAWSAAAKIARAALAAVPPAPATNGVQI